MSLPFRRRSRPRGRARLALAGDFPSGDHDMTEALQRADYDGATYDRGGRALPHGVRPVAVKQHGQDTEPLAWLRSRPRYAPPPRGHFTGVRAETTWHPAPVREEQPIMLAGQQAPWVMTVDPPRPGGPGPTQAALDVVGFLRARVTILRRRGQLDRISQDKLAMLPSDRIRNRRTTARLIVDEAAELLRCGGDPR